MVYGEHARFKWAQLRADNLWAKALARGGDWMSNTREQAHELIDRLPETQLAGLVQFLETIVDPVAGVLAGAPLDDEEESEEERAAAVEAGWLERNGGKGIPHAEAMRRLGLE